MKKVLQLLTLTTLLTTSLSATWLPIHAAAADGDLDGVQLLLDAGVDVNVRDCGWTPLHRAAFWGHTKVVRLLSDRGASVNVQDNDGWTPLHSAANNGRTETAQFLIARGASIDVQTMNNSTPLHLAASCGSTEIVQLLIDCGVSVHTQDNAGWTPLHWAARSGSTEIARLLIDNGARVDIQDNNGNTPPHRAAIWGHIATVRFLIDCGASVDAQNNDGLTPLLEAARHYRRETAEVIKTLPRLNKLLWNAVLNNSLVNVRWLLAHDASPNAIALESMFSITDNTPEDIANYLNALFARKDTPLHIAAVNRNVEMVKLLLGFGGRVDTPNNEGDTPLAMAAGRPEIMDIIYKAAEPLSEIP